MALFAFEGLQCPARVQARRAPHEHYRLLELGGAELRRDLIDARSCSNKTAAITSWLTPSAAAQRTSFGCSSTPKRFVMEQKIYRTPARRMVVEQPNCSIGWEQVDYKTAIPFGARFSLRLTHFRPMRRTHLAEAFDVRPLRYSSMDRRDA